MPLAKGTRNRFLRCHNIRIVTGYHVPLPSQVASFLGLCYTFQARPGPHDPGKGEQIGEIS